MEESVSPGRNFLKVNKAVMTIFRLRYFLLLLPETIIIPNCCLSSTAAFKLFNEDFVRLVYLHH